MIDFNIKISQHQKMDISIVIVNYNVRYFLEQVLLSIRQAVQDLDVEVFVVDNNSVDDSNEMVRNQFPEVKLIANKDNPGFSIANNQAIHQSKGKYVLLLNPDTVIEEQTLTKCFNFMESHPDAGGLGVRMIDGTGKFLPESKRGFPTPFVAFAKSFGLSKLFPKSKTFNHYHLGYLDEYETHEVEVLAGAFMFLRKSVLDEIGLLDEAFFMYGEDIDLSYRIIKGGYKNYYLPETTILHYKGESTKKGSLNYVKAFYNAMIIFAKKHFEGHKAQLFILILQGAIYLRALITLLSNWAKKLFLPLLDALLIGGGLIGLQHFWANYHFHNPDYFKGSNLLTFNFPLYILVWVITIYFSGGYDTNKRLGKTWRGVLVGTVLLAAIYGFLDMQYRHSRALILLGTAWNLAALSLVRLIFHFFMYGNFQPGKVIPKRQLIVGECEEVERVRHLLLKNDTNHNVIGAVSAGEKDDSGYYLASLAQLSEAIAIYKITEVIFCARNVRSEEILHWMSLLGSKIEYKIVPIESMSIIGSSSRNDVGEIYTIDVKFNLSDPVALRNKRILDLGICMVFMIPAIWGSVASKKINLKHWWQVLIGKKSWVSYTRGEKNAANLPPFKSGVFNTIDGLNIGGDDLETIARLNFLYAKDYETGMDMEILWRVFIG